VEIRAGALLLAGISRFSLCAAPRAGDNMHLIAFATDGAAVKSTPGRLGQPLLNLKWPRHLAPAVGPGARAGDQPG